jgi:hypothetical protein
MRLFERPDRPKITAHSQQFTMDFPMAHRLRTRKAAGETRLTLADQVDRIGPLPQRNAGEVGGLLHHRHAGSMVKVSRAL